MSLVLKILTEASVDIKEYATWYSDISPSLSIRFVSQLYDGFAKIVTILMHGLILHQE